MVPGRIAARCFRAACERHRAHATEGSSHAYFPLFSSSRSRLSVAGWPAPRIDELLLDRWAAENPDPVGHAV